MKYGYLLSSLCLSILVSTISFGQERYLNPVFDAVDVQQDVLYAANYTVLFSPVTNHSNLIPLTMDVYQPAGDTLRNRPLVIMLHTGNFLPIQTNGSVNGSKRDSAVVEVCNRLAKMGYVVASADYRLGWNPFAESASLRTLGLINAAYSGLQDARTCVRFFKKDKAELGDNFGVDTSKIVMWGQGTGGYVALAAATVDQYSDVVMTSQPQGKFLTDLNGDGMPDPMVFPDFNGDIYGTSLGLSPGGSIPAGDTLCMPNHVGYSSDFQLCVNMGGALGDIGWLDEGDVPMIAFQVPLDEFAPYESKILDVPSPAGALPVVEVQGSKLTIEKAVNLGNNEVFASVDDPTTDAAKAASAAAGHDYYNGLYPFNRPINIFGRVDGSPWNWWEPEKWDTIVHSTAGMGNVPDDVTYHDVSLLADPDMSPEKGRAYIDTIMAYYAPRAFLALGLGDTVSTSVPVLGKEDVGLILSPNPSYGFLQARTHVNKPMRTLRVVDVTGKLLLERARIHASEVTIDHTHLSQGIYFVEITLDEGRIIEKVAFE